MINGYTAKISAALLGLLGLTAVLRANDLTTGLLAHYPLDGNASDVSGNGNHGTNHGTTPGTDRFGRPGKASSFDGNNDSISLPIGASLSTDSTDLTFSLWVNSRATDNQDVLEQATDPVKGRSIIVTRSSGIFSTNVSGCGNFATQANYLRNSWYHIVVTNDVTGNSALIALYLNGISKGSVAKSNPEPSNQNYLLGRSMPENNRLDGLIDDLRIYNRALSASDVQALYNLENTPPNQAPSFSDPATFTTPENNASATFQPTASDPDGDVLTYQIFGGADHTKFDVNASTGSITFKTTPDFENPSDANADNAYRVRVRASDGAADANRTLTIHVTNLNETPTDLNSTATLSIAENQPVGTLVGQFTATDPDLGATLSYRLTGGQGSQHNDRFTLDANGTLRTAKVFDYENRQQLKIRVRVADEHNASLKQALVVLVADVVEQNATNVPERFRPVVETRPAKDVAGTSATLRGKIEDNGGSAVTERGFLLSTRPNPKPGRPNVQRLDDANGSTNFRTDALDLGAGKKYFFRAFATNAKGTSLGPVETFTTTTATQGPSWINAQPGVAAGWWRSPWFGNFFINPNGWTRHEKLGWIYPVESPTAGLWLWKKDVGWLWTDKGIHPFLFDDTRGWLYFFGQYDGTLLFYDYSAKRWITNQDGQ